MKKLFTIMVALALAQSLILMVQDCGYANEQEYKCNCKLFTIWRNPATGERRENTKFFTGWVKGDTPCNSLNTKYDPGVISEADPSTPSTSPKWVLSQGSVGCKIHDPSPCSIKPTEIGKEPNSLETLRTFRNEKLGKSERGKELTSLYYGLGALGTRVINDYPHIKDEIERIVRNLIPDLEASGQGNGLFLRDPKGLMQDMENLVLEIKGLARRCPGGDEAENTLSEESEPWEAVDELVCSGLLDYVYSLVEDYIDEALEPRRYDSVEKKALTTKAQSATRAK